MQGPATPHTFTGYGHNKRSVAGTNKQLRFFGEKHARLVGSIEFLYQRVEVEGAAPEVEAAKKMLANEFGNTTLNPSVRNARMLFLALEDELGEDAEHA